MVSDDSTTTSASTASAANGRGTRKPQHRSRNVVFVHLDLGVGGAEQLVVRLASASLRDGDRPTIMTTHCSPTHCFDEVKPGGPLSPFVRVRGAWIPSSMAGRGTALCSALRIAWLTFAAIFESPARDADAYVVDVLPTGLPLLRWFRPSAAIVFYCHFPDKLLTRDTVNGVRTTTTTTKESGVVGLLRRVYRRVMNVLEEVTMDYADSLVVNSEFTRETVLREFPRLRHCTNETRRRPLRVLHPAVDFAKFENAHRNADDLPPEERTLLSRRPVVSLNRFERKKNVGVLIRAYADLRSRTQSSAVLPPLVIAGGYDPRNAENREHLEELRSLAKDSSLAENVDVFFRPNVSDSFRASLLSRASCLVYTPLNEHFGIVPVEAAYAETPVVAVNAGGPRETVAHGETGLLTEGDSVEVFSEALETLLLRTSEEERRAIGRRARARAERLFGVDAFRERWALLMDEAAAAAKRDRGDARTISLRAVVVTTTLLLLLIAVSAARGFGT